MVITAMQFSVFFFIFAVFVLEIKQKLRYKNYIFVE